MSYVSCSHHVLVVFVECCGGILEAIVYDGFGSVSVAEDEVVDFADACSQVAVPDLINRNYVDALLLLQNAGFVCEIENATSDTVSRDYVISSSPAAGEEISYGSTVYITVSSGPEILFVDVPNLVGISEDAAKAKLEAARLSYGGAEHVSSDFEAGTVIGQIPEAFSQIEEHSKITLVISSGQGE